MNRDILVSVVVAVYNVEQYLERCIDSIVSQSHSSLEIILVNDGSTDSSAEICHDYGLSDKRIVVIDKENGGLTSARKTGFENAHGNYLVFLDSDDYLETTYIERLLQCMLRTDSDITICSYYYEVNGEQFPQCMHARKEYFTKDELANDLIRPGIYPLQKDLTRIPNFIWLRLYKRKVIAEDCFVSEQDVYTEDLFFNAAAYKRSNKVSILDEPLYHYCANQASLTNKYRSNRYVMEKKRIHEIEQIFNDYEIEDIQRLKLLNIRLITGCIENASKLGTFKSFKKELIEVFNDQSLRSMSLGAEMPLLSPSGRIFYYCFKCRLYFVAYLLTKIKK